MNRILIRSNILHLQINEHRLNLIIVNNPQVILHQLDTLMKIAIQLPLVQRHRRSSRDIRSNLMELNQRLTILHNRLNQQHTMRRIIRQLLSENKSNALSNLRTSHDQCLSVVSIQTVTGNASRGDTLQGRSSLRLSIPLFDSILRCLSWTAQFSNHWPQCSHLISALFILKRSECNDLVMISPSADGDGLTIIRDSCQSPGDECDGRE